MATEYHGRTRCAIYLFHKWGVKWPKTKRQDPVDILLQECAILGCQIHAQQTLPFLFPCFWKFRKFRKFRITYIYIYITYIYIFKYKEFRKFRKFRIIYIYICLNVKNIQKLQKFRKFRNFRILYIYKYLNIKNSKNSENAKFRKFRIIYIYIFKYKEFRKFSSTLRWHMPTQTIFSASWGSCILFLSIYIYICICSTLRWHMPTQTVFSAAWGLGILFLSIHIYIYMYLFHTKMAHAHPNRFLCLVGFLVFFFYPYIYIYICICSTLRWHMPTQTVFSASWGAWYSIFIHIYIYIYVSVPH